MTKKTKTREKEREYQRLVEQETLIFEATELLSELIEESGENRKELAGKLGRSKGFVTQILAGDRNMTLRTLADFAFALEHRVKVAAAPLVEHGDGGEAVGVQGPVVARVFAGAGELLAQPERDEAGDDPRRPLAAEGAGLYASGGYTTYVNALAGSERAELLLWNTVQPAPVEIVAT
jgi:antitoxin component HigA of HigAB toxin-antitoxin module